jgi:hypothetical protein
MNGEVVLLRFGLMVLTQLICRLQLVSLAQVEIGITQESLKHEGKWAMNCSSPWNAAIDGGDLSVDCSCLIRTAIRYAVIKQGMMTNLQLYCFAQW